MNNLANNIIQKIKAGEVHMQPRWHFVLKTALLLTGTLLTFLIAIYILSFVLFTLHNSGLWFAPEFGSRGVMMFIMGAPWLLLSILGLFLLFLYVLVSHYSFSYRKPLVYSIIGIVFLIISTSSLIHLSGIHDRLESFANEHSVPGLRPFYQDPQARRPGGVEIGTINQINESGFLLMIDRQELVQIIITKETKLPPDYTPVEGEMVLVIGERNDQDSITAFGIKPAKDGRFKLSPRHRDN